MISDMKKLVYDQVEDFLETGPLLSKVKRVHDISADMVDDINTLKNRIDVRS